MISNTQAELNSYWEGTSWTLAERYTDLLKSIFVGLFFLVLLPTSLFVTAFASEYKFVASPFFFALLLSSGLLHLLLLLLTSPLDLSSLFFVLFSVCHVHR